MPGWKWLFGDLSKKDVQEDLCEQVSVDIDPNSDFSVYDDSYLCKDHQENPWLKKVEDDTCLAPQIKEKPVSPELRRTFAVLRARKAIPVGFNTRPDFLSQYYTEIQRIQDIKRLGLHVDEYQKLTEDQKDTVHQGFKLLVECGAMEVLENVRRAKEESEPKPAIEWGFEPSASPTECDGPTHGDNHRERGCQPADAERDVASDSDVQ